MFVCVMVLRLFPGVGGREFWGRKAGWQRACSLHGEWLVGDSFGGDRL